MFANPTLLSDIDMQQFLMGLKYKKAVPEEELNEEESAGMIQDFIEWKRAQEPFVDDREFFKQKYDVDPQPITMAIIQELYFIRKELDEMRNA